MGKERTAKVVVVGGGFAGIETVRTLTRLGFKGELTLVSKKAYFEYYPALYRLVTGALPIEASVPLRRIFPQSAVRIREATLTALDPVKRNITLEGGDTISYNYLVLALGSETNYFKVPGIEELSYSFKSVDEALRLKTHLEALVSGSVGLQEKEIAERLQVVIVGGGPSGVELAGDLRDYLRRVCRAYGVNPRLPSVTIFESNSRLLPQFPESASDAAERRLRRLGVNIFTSRALAEQEVQSVSVNGMVLASKTLVWTAGTSINRFYRELPETAYSAQGRVMVGASLNHLVHKDIFIVGDGAGTSRSGLAQTAIRHGAYVAKVIHAKMRGKEETPYQELATGYIVPIGNNWAILVYRGRTFTGFFPWLLRNAVDFRYFTRIVPFWYVIAVFFKGWKYRRTHGGCRVPSNPSA